MSDVRYSAVLASTIVLTYVTGQENIAKAAAEQALQFQFVTEEAKDILKLIINGCPSPYSNFTLHRKVMSSVQGSEGASERGVREPFEGAVVIRQNQNESNLERYCKPREGFI
ncbi:hypothetical protein B0H16DRAFT_1475690 [Mycena metata]|uniref:Uncharacterized protein n=1 Tax=Mycena metata TaxID=1033252 RepID=A0AAD7MIS1_9AGAR|nr:hypothetical protein B0H16DRAFT_1475690 [Mycena metata]